MALDDFYTNFSFFLRWVHIMSGITWIGMLYFFNFVNSQVQPKIPAEMKSTVNLELMPRTLWWFRWGAMFTFLAGLTLLLYKYGHQGLWMDDEGQLTGRAKWIMFGATLGTIMWFNVWFIIWPAQKQILAWTKSGENPPEKAALASRAGFFSKVNTYLSGPMLFGMIAPNNYGAFSIPTMLIVLVVGLGVIWGLYKIAKQVGGY